MSSENTPKIIQHEGEEALASECKNLIRESFYYQYQGFWCRETFIKGVISFQKHFQVQDSDIFLAALPKSGTTWLKAIMFTLVHRKRHPIGQNHPLLSNNPQDLVPLMELEFNPRATAPVPDISSSVPSPRVFSTHIPYSSLPESARNSSACKFVYLFRNHKDSFVSYWHFVKKIFPQEMVNANIGKELDRFCKGVSSFGPYWDHVLGYWKERRESPNRIFCLKYEDMKEEPGPHLRRLAEFLGFPISADEEESGLVEEILKLCTFDHLSGLEVNMTGKLQSSVFVIENNAFFRKGVAGDWKNYLTDDMADKLDRVIEEKFCGSGLIL